METQLREVRTVKLDVVVPTYNRSQMLSAAISSLLRAPMPLGLEVTLWIVDNNSSDDTESVVHQIQAKAVFPCFYIKETTQGSSQARNAGISAGNGEIVGFIDDDEEVDENWFKVVAREFAGKGTQFIAGACLPDWDAPAPAWLFAVPGYQATIGVQVPLPRSPIGGNNQTLFWGGNAAVRRSVFECVGLFSTILGRSAKSLLGAEDKDLEARMVSLGLHGIYVPDMIIYHHVPAYRLTHGYFRRNNFWAGVSQGVMDRDSRAPVRYMLGIPRYRIGNALKGLASLARHLFCAREEGLAFADELPSWQLLGFIYGKHFIRIERYYSKQ